MLPYLIIHGWFFCNALLRFFVCWFIFSRVTVIFDISSLFLSVGGFFHILSFNATPPTKNIVPTVEYATLRHTSQVVLFMWGGNSALNPACSLRQYYLWTVVRHAVFWGCQMLFTNKHFARVSQASSPFWRKQGRGHPPPFSIGYKDQNVNKLSWLSSLLQSSVQW